MGITARRILLTLTFLIQRTQFSFAEMLITDLLFKRIFRILSISGSFVVPASNSFLTQFMISQSLKEWGILYFRHLMSLIDLVRSVDFSRIRQFSWFFPLRRRTELSRNGNRRRPLIMRILRWEGQVSGFHVGDKLVERIHGGRRSL